MTTLAPGPADPTHLARLPVLPFMDRRVARGPGVQPLDAADWLWRDPAFDPQMALRDMLLAGRPGEVMALIPEGRAAAAELLVTVLDAIARDPGYAVRAGSVTRPDGVEVPLGDPVPTMGRLVQEDLLILDRPEGAGEHRLLGGVLCFPSRWSLAEKMARGLLRIHEPVPFYAEALASRVQRLFDAIRPERPLWRANWLIHGWPELHQPASETSKKRRSFEDCPLWLRVERQTLRRLPRTGAVIFGIKTDVARIESLTGDEGRAMIEAIRALPETEFRYKGGEALMDRLRGVFGG